MLEVINLGFEYPEKVVLKGVEFMLNPHELLHLQGSNGKGKTTLLKILTGILRAGTGDVLFQGASIHKHLPSYQNQLRYVGHKNGQSQMLTLRENCSYELHNPGHDGLFEGLVKTFSLTGMEDMPCGLLSHGQRRRASLLRLLMSDVALWFLDEPLEGLDESAIALLMLQMHHHLGRGGAVVVTSHQQLPILGPYQEYCL
jgi:heme exporter protein A